MTTARADTSRLGALVAALAVLVTANATFVMASRPSPPLDNRGWSRTSFTLREGRTGTFGMITVKNRGTSAVRLRSVHPLGVAGLEVVGSYARIARSPVVTAARNFPPREYRSPDGGLAEEFAPVEGFEIPPGEYLHLIFAVRRAAGHDRLGHRPRFTSVAISYDYFGRRYTTTLRDGVSLCPPGRC